MNSRHAALSFDNVSFQFSVRSPALRSCTFSLAPGEWLTLMGANGSGKSTVARLAAGLLSPTAGRVTAFGVPSDQVIRAPAGRMGYMSQYPEHHVIGMTVLDDVLLSASAVGYTASEAMDEAAYWLGEVGLAGYDDRMTAALSGGELARLALATVLVQKPRLLVLDEPTAFAHAGLRSALLDVVHRFRSTTGAAVLWVTHHTDETAVADRIMVLHKGSVVYDDRPHALWGLGEAVADWGVEPLQPAAAQPSYGAERPAGKAYEGERPVLHMHSVAFRYAGASAAVLDDVHLHVESGERVALLGPSGSGKTTLLQLAALLHRPTGGYVKVLDYTWPAHGERSGRGCDGRHRNAVQQRIGMAWQQPEAQLFGRTVRADFAFSLDLLGIDVAEWDDRMLAALATFDMPADVLDRSPFALSGGERRKVALALCLAADPDLYLFDEPTAGLDYPGRRAVGRWLERLAQTGTAALFTTHDGRLAAVAAQRVVTLEAAVGAPAVADDGEREKSTFWWLRQAVGRVDNRLHVVAASLLALTIASVSGFKGLAFAALTVALFHFAHGVRVGQWWRVGRSLLPFIVIAALFAPPMEAGMSRPAVAVFIGLRLMLVIVSVLWLTSSIRLGDLLAALHSLLSPLAKLRVPVDSIVAGTLIGARMVPIITDEAKRLHQTQLMRGIGLKRGVGGLWLRTKALIVPLSIAVMRRAEQLGEALTVRGVSSPMRSGDAARLGNKRNWVYMTLTVLLLAGIVLTDRG